MKGIGWKSSYLATGNPNRINGVVNLFWTHTGTMVTVHYDLKGNLKNLEYNVEDTEEPE